MSEQLAVADVLERAADLIEPEGKWTRGHYARNKRGRSVRTREAATCFCAIGAIDYVSGGKPGSEMNHSAMMALGQLLGGGAWRIADWNDDPERTQAEVVAKLREAAAKARESVA